ncbi:MAG: F0F1 ATP synthase subunit delta [Deltaproteobacteria bacterium]|nr:F0F1 ATP synthase subunit delta [Deltaproteobacteria bacterium]
MEFDWTTFALEVLNFLVLVWLLKRFFYRPVLAVIEARQEECAKTIADAEAVRLEAEELKSQYLAHLAERDKERAEAKARLDKEISGERLQRLAVLEVEIGEERQRREAVEARKRSEREHALEREAMTITTLFATRFLDRLAGPELEARLADLTLSELGTLAPDTLEAMRIALQEHRETVKVTTAYPLDEVRRTAFTQALGLLAGRAVVPEFSEDVTLKAGVCIIAGAWVLMANLRDELNFFTGTFDHDG